MDVANWEYSRLRQRRKYELDYDSVPLKVPEGFPPQSKTVEKGKVTISTYYCGPDGASEELETLSYYVQEREKSRDGAEIISEELNRLGRIGWELVGIEVYSGVFSGGTYVRHVSSPVDQTFWLKRCINE